jgi:SpoVK/Ycf46/Vps4 family AAA+-type ATPase
MALDPSVLAAIGAAVQADPDNDALRLHYASLLHQANQPADALEQCASILAKQPDHLEALALAAETAEASGDKIRAHSYRNMHQALNWNRAKNLIEGVGEDQPLPEPPDEEPPREKVRLRESYGDEDEKPEWESELPEVTLKDVAGLEQVKERLNLSFLGPMRNPDLRKLYGKSLKGGLLLYGPPGCGKTFIARAVAGELGARFICIGLTDVIDMYIGESEKNLHEIFESARRNRPCVLFFDEIDALGRKRSLMREHAGRSVVNQLLAEMDGAQQDNEGVYVLAATNHPWDVDAALRRPGRLDRTLLVLPPDQPARAEILRHCLSERPAEGIDFAGVAAKTEDYSGADLVHLCESAAEFAIEDSIRSGRPRPIDMRDMKRALKEVRPSIRPWLETARNHALYANEGGIYDELLEYLRRRRLL